MEQQGLYIVLISLHGLIRRRDSELGRDPDTGGQTKYVVELSRALAADERVLRVDLMTRLVEDPKISSDYAVREEPLAEKAAIIRIPFGPKRYVRKELLWPWLGQFVDGALKHFRAVGVAPDVVHAHYADAGWVGSDLAALLSVPLVFTGHSLGHEKQRRLLESGIKPETLEARFNISQRIEAEEKALSNAALVVASTTQEVQSQYAGYGHYRKSRTTVIPPGLIWRASVLLCVLRHGHLFTTASRVFSKILGSPGFWHCRALTSARICTRLPTPTAARRRCRPSPISWWSRAVGTISRSWTGGPAVC